MFKSINYYKTETFSSLQRAVPQSLKNEQKSINYLTIVATRLSFPSLQRAEGSAAVVACPEVLTLADVRADALSVPALRGAQDLLARATSIPRLV